MTRFRTVTLTECINGTQTRARLDNDTIEEYAAAMRAGDCFPPIVMFAEPAQNKTPELTLADGFHRVAAAILAGHKTIRVDVREGTARDALLYAVGANNAHGLRRTNADKRHAVELLLADAEWRRWSDREIARRCGVENHLVGDVRASLSDPLTDPGERLYTTKHGTVATMHVAGLRQANGHGDGQGLPRESLNPPPEPLSPLGVHFSSDSVEHYTPPEIIEAVVACLGAIDLDPCSDDEYHVPATRAYTRTDDGLRQPWSGRVYMNPPYGRDIEPWVAKLVAEHVSGNVTEAIALVPARTDTQWFRLLRDYVCCFVTGRLTFIGNDDPAPFPSALFYLGNDIDAFYRAFNPIGDVWQRIEPGMYAE